MLEKDPSWQEIQEYRRKGASLAEFWQFILNSTQRQEAWLRHVPRSSLDFEMWQFLMMPARICYLELWEKAHANVDFTSVLWEEIIHFLQVPKQIHREVLRRIGERTVCPSDAVHFLVQSLRDEEVSIRRKTLEILRKMGPLASEGVPSLIQALRDPNIEIQQRAFSALMEMGGNSIEETLLKKPSLMNESQRRQAIQILGQIKATSSIGILLTHLAQDDSPKVRASAAWALGKIGVVNDFIEEALLSGIHDLDERVRAESAQSLGDLSILNALPQLLPLLQDSVTSVQIAARQSIKRMRTKTPENS